MTIREIRSTCLVYLKTNMKKQARALLVMEVGKLYHAAQTNMKSQFNIDADAVDDEEAQDRKLWRALVAAIEPEDTLELQKRKKARKTRSSGPTDTMDLDASQWLKGVNKQGKFDGGLIAK